MPSTSNRAAIDTGVGIPADEFPAFYGALAVPPAEQLTPCSVSVIPGRHRHASGMHQLPTVPPGRARIVRRSFPGFRGDASHGACGTLLQNECSTHHTC